MYTQIIYVLSHSPALAWVRPPEKFSFVCARVQLTAFRTAQTGLFELDQAGYVPVETEPNDNVDM